MDKKKEKHAMTPLPSQSRSSLTSSITTFGFTEIVISELAADMDPEGVLTTPLVLDGTTLIDLSEMTNHGLITALGSMKFTAQLTNISDQFNRPFPGQCLFWSHSSMGSYQELFGLPPINPVVEGFSNGECFFVSEALTTLGMFLHDPVHVNYDPTQCYDYNHMYTFYPFNEAVPFGDVAEVWTVERNMDVNGDGFDYSYTVTGSLHPGKSYTTGTGFGTEGAVSDHNLVMGCTGDYRDFKDHPIGMTLLSAHVDLNDVSGVKPTITSFTISAVCTRSENAQSDLGFSVTDLVASDVNTSVVGYLLVEDVWPYTNPLPFVGQFNAEAPTVGGLNAGGAPGVRYAKLWVLNETNDVSDMETAETFVTGVTWNGTPLPSTCFKEIPYEEGMVNIATLDMVTPNVGDAITITLTGQYKTPYPYNTPISVDLFEVVAGVLKFKTASPARSTLTDVSDFIVFYSIEDEHSNSIINCWAKLVLVDLG